MQIFHFMRNQKPLNKTLLKNKKKERILYQQGIMKCQICYHRVLPEISLRVWFHLKREIIKKLQILSKLYKRRSIKGCEHKLHHYNSRPSKPTIKIKLLTLNIKLLAILLTRINHCRHPTLTILSTTLNQLVPLLTMFKSQLKPVSKVKKPFWPNTFTKVTTYPLL